MSIFIQNSLLAGVASLSVCLSSFVVFAQTNLPEVGVEAIWSPYSTLYQNIFPDTHSASRMVGGDGGDYLKSVVGVSGSRMGGHGIDPVIHGQQQTQLNVINDGAYIHGGCPNRMDPPTAYATPDSYDSVVIEKGYQSVVHGSGGSGGTVKFERKPLPFERSEFEYSAKVGGGFQSNGHVQEASVDVGAGNKIIQLRGLWSHFSMDDYEDGQGQKVRSAATSENYALLPVWKPNDNTTIKAGVELTRMDDVLYAGAGMDSPFSNGLTHRFSFEHFIHGDFFKGFSFHAYQSDVDHLMDNYSLRDNTGMKMKTESESATFGGVMSGNIEVSGVPLIVGLDLQNNDKDAKRFSGMAMARDATTPQSYMWPDVRIRQTGLFVEADPELLDDVRLKVGGRYDVVTADAAGAERSFGAVSSNTLYLNHYGVMAQDKTEYNLGGLFRFEYDLTSNLMMFTGVSRSVRTADATERYMAANSGVASSRWVGNPDLAPEKHHQFDVGVSLNGGAWTTTVSGYYDRVSDYIFRDLARGQSGVVATSGETIYRNIDASLMGFDYQTSYQLTPHWALGGAVAYTYGQNRTDDDALSQIPPLEGRVSVDYIRDVWSFGTALNFAMKQNRTDNDTALRDVGKTSGYGTLDLYAKADLKPFDVSLGVYNLFDKTYAAHLNRGNAVDPTEIQVNEPGRSIGLRISGRF
ncbi:MAG: TonB-dependent copper receptor [Alphaproteobacteria bacterium]|nr:TonB-dependent copper receptor [Alphaproteobacteria bacterium]MCB9985238.1 TonB-dependent copper receptor [Micavibrio sp.]